MLYKDVTAKRAGQKLEARGKKRGREKKEGKANNNK
jgi:hypothetical protein